MTRNFRYKPGERDHITIVGEASPGNQIMGCGICRAQWPPPDGFKGRARFAYQYWMKQHIKCAKAGDGPVVKCPVPEARGIDDSMPKTQHLLDRQIRHFPYETLRDGRDYGRKQEKKSDKRRKRQTDRAICDEWPIWSEL